MSDIRDKRRVAILAVLNQHGGLLTSNELTSHLEDFGHMVSERTVRLDLQDLDETGLTESRGKRGRRITSLGQAELEASHTHERLGYLSAKIDQMSYQMTFDLTARKGTIVVNTAMATPDQLMICVDRITQVYEQGYAMGRLTTLLAPGQSVGDTTVPEGRIGFCTVSSVTLNGVLLKHGIPARSRFGGLMEIRSGKPTRFVELIHYDGTTIDPLEVFIRSAMTDYLGTISTGNGLIGAGFRELPAASRDQVCDLARKLEAVGLGGFMRIGLPGHSLFDIPVSKGCIGATVIGGLNPSAVFEESGIRVGARALTGLLEFDQLFSYDQIPIRARELTH